MEVRLNNLINNTKIILYINSNDTVNDIKISICSSLYPYQKINPSGTSLYYIDKRTNQINYMLSPFRTILSYKGIFQSKELFIEQSGFQLDATMAILLENFFPLITLYYIYNKDDYDKLFIHKIIFFLIFFYFLCRLFIKLKCYKDNKYSFIKFIINNIIYTLFFAYFCGNSIFNDDNFNLFELNINSYLYGFIFLLCEILCLKFVKEYINSNYNNNQIKSILFNYVKYPFFMTDCIVWLSFCGIIRNKIIVWFTFIKIIYNIYLAFELYIEERGMQKGNNYFYYNNNNYDDYRFNNNKKNINQKIIFPFTL